MNLKQIVKNVSDTIKRKRGEKTDEDYEESSLDEEEEEEALTPEQEAEMEIDSPEGNKSMLKGDHGKIFGVSKPVVIGVGVFFLVVFMLAFIYASSDSSKPDKPSSTQDMKTQIAAEDSSINGKDGELADDYGDLHRANEKKKAGRTQQKLSRLPTPARLPRLRPHPPYRRRRRFPRSREPPSLCRLP